MQLILETIPVIREEDKDELLKVMPSFVSSTWEVKRPLRKLLPEVNSEGTSAGHPGQHPGGRALASPCGAGGAVSFQKDGAQSLDVGAKAAPLQQESALAASRLSVTGPWSAAIRPPSRQSLVVSHSLPLFLLLFLSHLLHLPSFRPCFLSLYLFPLDDVVQRM